MTFIDLFAGIGGFRKGLENAGHKCIGFCEFDKFAVASYTSMHLITEEQRKYLFSLDFKTRQKEILKEEYRNGEWYCDDIKKVNFRNIPKADCWCFGSPCFVAGTLITTNNGMKPIEEINIGDLVLTHNNTYEAVTDKMINNAEGIYTLQVQGSPITECTGNHRFYVRYKTRHWNNDIRRYEYSWTKPEWKAVESFTGKEYIKFPNKQFKCENPFNLTENECWLIGRYVADGYLNEYVRCDRPSNMQRIIFCIGNNKAEQFEIHLDKKVCYSSQQNCRKYSIVNHKLFNLCEKCGKNAINKHIPDFILNLPKNLLIQFIEGYMSGDGSHKDGLYRASSISKVLIYQLAQCIYRVYDCSASIYFYKRPTKTIIEGRLVNQRDTWNLAYRLTKEKTSSAIIDEELWQPVKKICYDRQRNELVYNLEVENEHSYTANNLAAHNCQDFSIAGFRQGLEGNRSSLIREVFRIIREQDIENRPEWLIYENVKGMLSSNRGFDFLAILLELDELGYDCEWQTFNTRYFGIPQNRERVYTIGHLRTKGERKIFPFQTADNKNSVSKINVIGHREGFHRNMQIIDPNSVATTIDTATGGGRELHTAIPLGMLRNVRNDYAKSIRKDYEQGNVEAKRADLVEKDIRTDGVANTIDTVKKDNLLAVGINSIENISKGQNGIIYDSNGISPTLRSDQGVIENGIGSNNSSKVAIPVDDNVITIKMSRSKGFSETDIAPTLLATNYKGIGNLTDNADVCIPVMTPEKEHKRANGRRFKDIGDPSFTLTTVDRHGVAIGVTPIAGVYINESEKFSSPFMKDISKTLKASNDVGTVVAVDVSENAKDLSETIVSDKIINTNMDKIKSKGKSLFNIKSNSNVTSVEENKMTSGLYVQLDDNTTVYCVWYEKYKSYIAIRKLTPKENFRLQGWSDEYFERAKFVNSDSQLYKQAGNGVTVAVVEEIGNALQNIG